jgi:pimeloyl-ACP methyl ester carboxylesterase
MQQAISIIHRGQEIRGMQHILEGKKAPAVIMLHGFTGNKLEPHRFFLKISRALEELGIASFRFDFLGSGESDGSFEEMTVLSELDEARSILKYVQSHPAVDQDRIVVLGFSMGGLIASLLAGELEKEIQKLILLAPAGTMVERIDRYIHNTTFIPSHNAYDVGGNLVGKRFVEELKTIDVWSQAANFKKEVLLIHGTRDEAVPFEVSSQYIEKSYGNKALLHAVEGADHTFNSYQWEKEVIETIGQFLTCFK